MAAKTSTVTVQILADNSQYKREMGETAQVTDKSTRQMGGATEGLGKKMSTFAKVAVAAIAVTALSAVKDFVADSIRAFSDLNESLNAVEVTFGENAEGIKELGEQAAKSLGLSNAEFNSFAVQMSAFAHAIAGDGGDVVGVVDELSTRVSDFASVMNLEVAEAARLFQSGLAGETEPLRRYGLDLSAAAVKAHALAEGISDGSGELSEQEKVLARYSLLMKQTEKVAGDFANTSHELANSQRIAAAEMENAKARAGEALVPFAQLTTQLKLLAAETLGVVATSFNVLFTDMTKAEGAAQSFEILTGETADSLAALVTLNQDTGVSFEELAATMQLTAEESVPLTESQKDFLTELGYEQDEIKALDRLLVGEHAAALDRAKTGTGEYAAATEDLTGETEEAISALDRFESEVRSQFDPMFGLLDALEKVEDAQRQTAEAADEYTVGSPEHRAAVRDEAQAWLDLKAKQVEVASQMGLTRGEFEMHLKNMTGLTDEQINLILEDFDRLNRYQFDPKEIRISERRTTQSSSAIGGRQHGGPVQRNVPVLVGEAGPEVLVPSSNGTVIPNHRLNGNGGTSLGGTTINLTVYSLDPNTSGRVVVEALQSYMRSNGALPITVRSA